MPKGRPRSSNPLDAEDTRLTAGALRSLGVAVDEQPGRIVVTGCNGILPNRRPTTLDLDNSGTSLRLLTSLALLCRHPVILTGSARMQERPIGPLAGRSPRSAGRSSSCKMHGYPPLRVSGQLLGGPVAIDGSMSSQFISSILMAAPYAQNEVEVIIPAPPASASYLDITLDVMEAFGAKVERDGYERFVVSTADRYQGRRLRGRRRLLVRLVLLCPCRDLRRQGDGGEPGTGIRAGRPQVPRRACRQWDAR